MHIAIWLLTLLLLGLWTLSAWGLAALLGSNGDWLTHVGPWLAQLPFGGWLETWFPEWLQSARLMLDALQAALSWLGATAPTLVWIAWGVGAALLLLLAAGLSLLVALIRKATAAPPAPPSAPSPTAA